MEGEDYKNHHGEISPCYSKLINLCFEKELYLKARRDGMIICQEKFVDGIVAITKLDLKVVF